MYHCRSKFLLTVTLATFNVCPLEKLVCVFEKAGFILVRKKGSHHVLEKDGVSHPVIIPEYTEVGVDIIKSNLGSAGIARDEYFKLLNK